MSLQHQLAEREAALFHAQREVEELRGRLDALANDVAGQLQDSGSQTNEVIERITAEMQQMAERFTWSPSMQGLPLLGHSWSRRHNR